MKSEIVKMEFMDTPVECIIKDGVKYISVTSIGNAIGVENDTIRKLLLRNKESFAGCSLRDEISHEGKGKRKHVCLSKEGIIGLMFILNVSSYPKEKQDTIIAFKKWAMKVLGEAYDQQFNGLIATSKEGQRDITKIAHHAVMSAVKTTYAPQSEDGVVPRKRYMDENIMLNTVAFGHHRRGMRNDVEFEELVRLSLAQGADLAMHERGVSDIYDRQSTINNMLTKHYIPAPQSQELLEEPLESFM